jgi:acetyl esterase
MWSGIFCRLGKIKRLSRRNFGRIRGFQNPDSSLMRSLFLIAAAGFLFLHPVSQARAQADRSELKKYPPEIPGARVESYREVEGRELKLWIFEGTGTAEKGAPRPAIVFFFGGGWKFGSPTQFVPQARALAERGMVACVADYRVASRDGVKPTECVADAKACVRWIRSNAGRLGVDPGRIIAAGGSAGGHLAAATAFLPGLDPDGKDSPVSSAPNALALFNPALVLAPVEGVDLTGFLANATEERLGCRPEEISPAHHVRNGGVPTLIHHGSVDSTVPFASAEKFAALMKAAGNYCELVCYEGQAHGFFNRPPFQESTLEKTDAFLVSLGYLPAKRQP